MSGEAPCAVVATEAGAIRPEREHGLVIAWPATNRPASAASSGQRCLAEPRRAQSEWPNSPPLSAGYAGRSLGTAIAASEHSASVERSAVDIAWSGIGAERLIDALGSIDERELCLDPEPLSARRTRLETKIVPKLHDPVRYLGPLEVPLSFLVQSAKAQDSKAW
jgi:hypothetical protein